jgi:hypothetical protein
MSADPREDIALFRFRIIGEAANPRLTPAERRARRLAASGVNYQAAGTLVPPR